MKSPGGGSVDNPQPPRGFSASASTLKQFNWLSNRERERKRERRKYADRQIDTERKRNNCRTEWLVVIGGFGPAVVVLVVVVVVSACCCCGLLLMVVENPLKPSRRSGGLTENHPFPLLQTNKFCTKRNFFQ